MSLIYGEKMPSVFDGTTGTIYERGQLSKEEESKLLHVVNDNPLKFETIISKMTTTTTKLAMQINEVFHNMFSDYYGSDVRYTENGIAVFLVFKPDPTSKGDDKRAFVPIQEVNKTTNDTVNRMMSINAINNARRRTMEITSYGMEIMYDLMNQGMRKKVNPKNPQTFLNFTGEAETKDGLYSPITCVYCTMFGLDLYRILDVIFGAKSKDGSRYIYNVKAMKPINMMPGVVSQNWIVEIERMTTSAFDKLSRDIGGVPIPGAISAVTETIR